jgi:hypothetical protein
MGKTIISQSFAMRGGALDDDYTLFEDGEILHEYDKHIYEGGYNLSEYLTADQLSMKVKQRLLDAAPDNKKSLVKELLGI